MIRNSCRKCISRVSLNPYHVHRCRYLHFPHEKILYENEILDIFKTRNEPKIQLHGTQSIIGNLDQWQPLPSKVKHLELPNP